MTWWSGAIWGRLWRNWVFVIDGCLFVLECITTVSYSILVNGEPKGDIRPSRGLRQGDPLSLYLFLLCSEGLNRMLQQAASNDTIRVFSLCKRGPKISHLFFADDTL